MCYRHPLGGRWRDLGKTDCGRAFAYMCTCICVWFYLSLTCTDSQVSGKQLSLKAFITEMKATSSWSLTEFPRPVHDVGAGVRL